MKLLKRALFKAAPLFLIAPLLFSSCGDKNDGIAVSGVSVGKPAITLRIGDSEILTATVAPANADNRNVAWSSGNEDVATVNPSTGEVTGVSCGTATVTVTTEDGGKTAACVVTVIAVSVESVSLENNAITLQVCENKTLEAIVSPDNATDKSVTWSSSNSAVVSVNPSSGILSALKVGSAKITVTTNDGGKTHECTVTVADTYDNNKPKYNNVAGIVANCADPYILEHEGTYYLYGTGGSDGIRVHTSTDLVNWTTNQGATSGYALHKNDVWGTSNFWAPEVYLFGEKFYMFYSANERISMASAASPRGPFSTPSSEQKAFHANIGEIDTHVFTDDDGKKYIYFVRFSDGNCIWMAELNDDYNSILENTIKRCITATEPWELIQDKVIEGPFVLKREGYYFLTYSANHYQSKQYAVGYAYSTSPFGPWTKAEENPILIGDNTNIVGTGHHSFFHSPSGALYIVYHAHYSPTAVQSRKACIDRAMFDFGTTPAKIVIKGPTVTNQVVR